MEILLIAAFFAQIVYIGRWILGPIDRAAKLRQGPVRFSIGDFLCLFLAVQIPLAGAYQYVREGESGPFWMLTILTWIVAPVIWFAAARALSKAGVTNSVQRMIFMGLIVPLVYYGLLPFAILPFVYIQNIMNDIPERPNPPWDHRIIFVWLALAILFFLCGMFTRRIVRPSYCQSTTDERHHAAQANQALTPTLQE